MRGRTTLGSAGLGTSVLGLGCADLFRLPTRRERRGLLEAAYDAGIVHFDVAPMYGLGAAEPELGRFARARRGDVVLATKFGIGLTPIARGLARVQGPVRRAFEAAPQLRRRARAEAAGPGSGRAGALLYTPQGYDAASARKGLERSLRELETDHVDLFLLHDPSPHEVRTEEVCGYLEDARAAGNIREWGIAGEPGPSLQVAATMAERRPVLQLRSDVLMRAGEPASDGSAGHIAFGVLGRALPAIVAHVTADADRRTRWQAAIGHDCGVPETCASLLLREAIAADPAGVVLFTTTRPHRIKAAADAAASGTSRGDAALEALRALVVSELADTTARSSP